MIQYLYLGRVAYEEGLRLQNEIAASVAEGRLQNVLLLLEHPPVLTLGRNANRANVLMSDELLAARGIGVHEINRGGDVTYHGPGQLVGYPIFDLSTFKNPNGGRMGPVDFVRGIEEALIRLCLENGVHAGRVPGLTGVWCGAGVSDPGSGNGGHGPGTEGAAELPRGSAGRNCFVSGHDFSHAASAAESAGASAPEECSSGYASVARPSSAACETQLAGPERKIAAIGIHVAKGITSHGFSFNVTTDLRHFQMIVPCGIPDHGVTSLAEELRPPHTIPALESVAHQAARQFGLVFDRHVLAAESLDALRATASDRRFPAEDTPMRPPAEVEQLRGAPGHPVRA